MCGIFGITISNESDLNRDEIRDITDKLFLLSESRGKEASGIVYKSERSVYVCKAALPASKLIKTPQYASLAEKFAANSSLMGHARLVTNGSMTKPGNNQPVFRDGGIAVHNGIIVNDRMLWEHHSSLVRKYEVDTEIIPALLSLYMRETNDIIASIRRLLGEIKGTISTGILTEFFEGTILATNNGSLYYCYDPDRQFLVFASERTILTDLIRDKLLSAENQHRIRKLQPGKFILAMTDRPEPVEYSIQNVDNYARMSLASQKKDFDIELSIVGQNDAAIPMARSVGSLEDFHKSFKDNESEINALRRCKKCILPETMPFIEFDDSGECNYCANYREIERREPDELRRKIASIGDSANNCIAPLSGGRDSCYALHYLVKETGLTPVAFSYDWGMITDLARRNQARMCGELGVEHIIMSADISEKRLNIKKNVLAWLKKPDLGTIPLFMAGDKQYFYFLNKLKERLGAPLIIYSENPLEKTDFKTGFCGVAPKFSINHVYDFDLAGKLKLAFYYFNNFLRNPGFWNSSLFDTVWAYFSSYFLHHDYEFIYRYVRWDEDSINNTLINEYGWETAKDTKNTWRIGDGTAPFYNYIYYMIAGFTENDTFRSNQIREGIISREKALRLANEDNQPRYESIWWYCDTIGIDPRGTLHAIHSIPKLYGRKK